MPTRVPSDDTKDCSFSMRWLSWWMSWLTSSMTRRSVASGARKWSMSAMAWVASSTDRACSVPPAWASERLEVSQQARQGHGAHVVSERERRGPGVDHVETVQAQRRPRGVH